MKLVGGDWKMTFKYDGDKLLEINTDNEIITSDFVYDSEGKEVQLKTSYGSSFEEKYTSQYIYYNGNAVLIYDENIYPFNKTETFTCSYDNKFNPFINHNKYFKHISFGEFIMRFSKNNVINESSSDGVTKKYKITYDNEDFPVKIETIWGEYNLEQSIEYIYL